MLRPALTRQLAHVSCKSSIASISALNLPPQSTQARASHPQPLSHGRWYATKRPPKAPSTIRSERSNRPVLLNRSLPVASNRQGPDPHASPREISISALREWADGLDTTSVNHVNSVLKPSLTNFGPKTSSAIPSDNLRLLALLSCYATKSVAAEYARWCTLLCVDADQLYTAGRYLVGAAKGLHHGGRLMLSHAARLDHPDAVVYELQTRLRVSDPGQRAPGENSLRTKLKAICQDKLHVRALTLAAQLARSDGDAHTAIRHARKAIPPAIQAFANGGAKQLSRLQVSDKHDATSKPWLELGLAYDMIQQPDKALAALQEGMDVDDPLAFYHHAQIQRQAVPERGYTSRWVQHMTKAAASGHVLAMVELATFYAGGAKAEASESLQSPSMASLADGPEDLTRLAISWLDIAIGHDHAPASTLKTRLLAGESMSSSDLAQIEGQTSRVSRKGTMAP